jgi:hypothetical protein
MVEQPRPRAGGGRSKVLAVAALVLVAALVAWIALDLLGGDDDGSIPQATPGETIAGDEPGPALVVLVDAAGEVYGVTILAGARDAIVHVPPGTMVEVPSLGLTSLRESARGGADLLQHSLENLLGIAFDAAVSLDPAGLAAVVEPVGDLTVVVQQAVEERSSTGRVTVLVPAGRQTVAPTDVAGLLEPVGDGTSLERIVRHQAFWQAYLAALGEGAPAPGLGAVATAVRSLAGGDVTHQVLPVEAVAGIGGDDELYRVQPDALSTLVERLFPGASPVAERIRVRILNGVGAPGLAQRVQPLLVEAGGEVTLSGNADRFDYQTTQVVYYDDARLDAARAIRDAIGVGEVVKSLTPLDVVDVTIVVGADFVAEHGG